MLHKNIVLAIIEGKKMESWLAQKFVLLGIREMLFVLFISLKIFKRQPMRDGHKKPNAKYSIGYQQLHINYEDS